MLVRTNKSTRAKTTGTFHMLKFMRYLSIPVQLKRSLDIGSYLLRWTLERAWTRRKGSRQSRWLPAASRMQPLEVLVVQFPCLHNFAALLCCSNFSGVHFSHFPPKTQRCSKVYKDGYYHLRCMKDEMATIADYHNELTRVHEYKVRLPCVISVQ